jgi:hypothetical protein
MVDIEANHVTVNGFTITNPIYNSTADASGVVIGSGGRVSSIKVLNNIIEDIGTPTRTGISFGTFGINCGPVDGLEIAGNTITRIKHGDNSGTYAIGVFTWGNDATDNTNNINIHNNTIYDIQSPSIYDRGISTGYYGQNIAINENIIFDVEEIGISVSSDVMSVVTVHRNAIYNNGMGLANNSATYDVDATCNWWGSLLGPQYTTDGGATWIPSGGGDKVAGIVNFYPWSIAFPVTSCAPNLARVEKQFALDDLEPYLTIGTGAAPNKEVRDAVKEATKKINESRDNPAWIDPNHLTVKGVPVFDRERDAANILNDKILKKAICAHTTSSLCSAVQSAIDHLIAADTTLAEVAIGEVPAGCNGDQVCTDELKKANAEMIKAGKELAAKHYGDAIDHYKRAWGHALRALDHTISADLFKDPAAEIPTDFALAQNYPNPFNPTTTIRFGLPVDGNVSLAVYDVLGRQVAQLVEGRMITGFHEVTFDASNLSSGIYFYRMSAVGDNGKQFTSVQKMLLTK